MAIGKQARSVQVGPPPAVFDRSAMSRVTVKARFFRAIGTDWPKR